MSSRHVARCSERGTNGGKAEVDKHGRIVVPEEDVGGFDVIVGDHVLVQVGHRRDEVPEVRQRLVLLQSNETDVSHCFGGPI